MFEKLSRNEKGEGATDTLIEIAVGLTVLFIVLGYLFFPVGLASIVSVNRTAAGVVAGTTAGNIFDVLIPIGLVSIILAVIMIVRRQSKV